MLKPDHSLAWNNMVILLDNTGIEKNTDAHTFTHKEAAHTVHQTTASDSKNKTHVFAVLLTDT